jgi:hypothetical protein
MPRIEALKNDGSKKCGKCHSPSRCAVEKMRDNRISRECSGKEPLASLIDALGSGPTITAMPSIRATLVASNGYAVSHVRSAMRRIAA